MPIRLKFTDSFSQFKTNIIFALAEKVDQIIRSKIPRIEIFARETLKAELNKSETVSSLLGGVLQADFGLTDSMAIEAVDSIVDYLTSNIQVVYTKSRKPGDLLASFTLVLLPDPEVYNHIKNGSYISNGYWVTGYGIDGTINWLEWLMTRGTEVVITNFYVYYEEGAGRSNQAIMVYTDKGGPVRSGGFMVDPEHSGTLEDNFITRVINKVVPELRAFITREISL